MNKFRCAIYTRKSSEEGLEQDFNSLDAQREVTAERIRDKIAASKAKGMWMGGVVPLGDQANGRTLTIDEDHAALIRSIFESYLAVRNVRLLTRQLSEQDLHVPKRVTGTGRELGGKLFTRGQIYKILSNPIDVGKICHKGEIYEGQHAAVVDCETWDRVEAQLEANSQGEQQARTASSPSLLARKVFESDGNALIASHATKGTTRYCYYIGKSDESEAAEDQRTLRIPALELDKTVCEAVAIEIEHPLGLLAKAGVELASDTVANLADRASSLGSRLRKRERAAVRTCIEKVTIGPSQVSVELSAAGLCHLLSITPSSPATTNPTISFAASVRRSGRAVRLIQDGLSKSTEGEPQEHLLKLLHRACAWWQLMLDRKLTVSALAREQRVTSSYASRVVRLNFLAPRIVKAIVTGKQLIDLDAKKLLGLNDLSLAWSEQEERLLGG